MFKLKNKLQEIEQENENLKNSGFCGFNLSSDKIYNHFIAFPSINIIEAIFNFYRSRANAKNIILCKTKLINEDGDYQVT